MVRLFCCIALAFLFVSCSEEVNTPVAHDQTDGQVLALKADSTVRKVKLLKASTPVPIPAKINIVEGPYLWRVDGYTGEHYALGGPVWSNPQATVGYDANLMYIIQAGNFHAVDYNVGNYTVLGNYGIYGQGHVSMTSKLNGYDTYVYVIANQVLYRVNRFNGTLIRLGSSAWTNSSEIVSTRTKLFVFEYNSNLARTALYL